MSRKRSAFTLVELLVVIAIIMLLMGLVTAAVMHARELARQTTCLNRQKQLVFAAAMHLERKGHLPRYQQMLAGRPATWVVPLLHDLEEIQVSDRWQDPTIPAGALPRPYTSKLFCPSHPHPRTSIADTSYVANLGFYPRPTDPAPFNQGVTKAPPTANYDYWDAGRKANGPFVDGIVPGAWGNRPASHALLVDTDDFYDGLTNTLLFSENLLARTWDQPGLGTGFVWLYANDPGAPLNPSWVTGAVIPPLDVPPPPEAKINGLRRQVTVLVAETARPSSHHPGIVIAAFADGRVIKLSDQIEYHVYQSLMTLRDDRSDMPHRLFVLSSAAY